MGSWSQRSPQPPNTWKHKIQGEPPEACGGQGLPGQPGQAHTEGAIPCHPARDRSCLSWTKAQVSGLCSTLASHWAQAHLLSPENFWQWGRNSVPDLPQGPEECVSRNFRMTLCCFFFFFFFFQMNVFSSPPDLESYKTPKLALSGPRSLPLRTWWCWDAEARGRGAARPEVPCRPTPQAGRVPAASCLLRTLRSSYKQEGRPGARGPLRQKKIQKRDFDIW